MKDLSPLLFSVALHLGVAIAAWQAPQFFKWNEPEKEKKLAQIQTLELIPAKVNRVVPLKKQPKIPKKKRKIVRKAKPKKVKPKKAARKKKLVTQKQKSPVKVKQSRAQKAVAKVPVAQKAPTGNQANWAKNAPIGPKGSDDPMAPEDGRLLRQAAGNIPPKYPVIDRLRRNNGEVVVVGYVNNSGKVSRVRIGASTGTPDMEENSIQAFSNYRFQKGQAGWVKMPYEFVIGGEPTVISTRNSRQFDNL